MKILAVDDDALILELLVETLLTSGYTSVSTANCASEAARMIAGASEPYDCFLLDIMMPEVNGIDLARWIRKLPGHKTTPILMITSMSEKSFIDRAFLAGASDYVTKPFDTLEVATRVRLAEQQIHLRRAPRDSGSNLEAPPGHIPDHAAIPLAESITLEDVEGLIDFHALQNYLLQLSRGAFYATSVLALRIVDVGNIYARCSGPLFRDILADVAECALEAMSRTECIMAYAGGGTFAGVVAFAENHDFEDVELMINLLIERLELVDEQHRPIEVRVAIGPPQSIGVMKSGRVAVAKMHRAIEDLCWSMPLHDARGARAKGGAGPLLRAFTQSFGLKAG